MGFQCGAHWFKESYNMTHQRALVKLFLGSLSKLYQRVIDLNPTDQSNESI